MPPGHRAIHLMTYTPRLKPGHGPPHPASLRHNSGSRGTAHNFITLPPAPHNPARDPRQSSQPRTPLHPNPLPRHSAHTVTQITAHPQARSQKAGVPDPLAATQVPVAHSSTLLRTPQLRPVPQTPCRASTHRASTHADSPRAWGVCFGRQTVPQAAPGLVPQLTGQEREGRGPEQQQEQQERGWDTRVLGPRPGQRHGSTLCSAAMGTGGRAGSAPPLPPTSTNAVDRGPALPPASPASSSSPGPPRLLHLRRVLEEGSDSPSLPKAQGSRQASRGPVGLTSSRCLPCSPSRHPPTHTPPPPPASQVVLPQPPPRRVCSAEWFSPDDAGDSQVLSYLTPLGHPRLLSARASPPQPRPPHLPRSPSSSHSPCSFPAP